MKTAQKGFTLVELLVVIAIIATLAGALYPKFSAVMLRSDMTAAANQAKQIHQAILTADSGYAYRDIAWPVTVARSTEPTTTGDRVDLAMLACQNSVDYFNAMFNVANMNKPGYEKYKPIGELELAVLAGNGLSTFASGSKLDQKNVKWTIAANIASGVPDSVPAIITRNVDPASLLSKYDGKLIKEITFLTDAENGKVFGDEAFVGTTKGGAGFQYEADAALTNILYKGAFDLTDLDMDGQKFTYLTPTGKTEPKAGN